MFYLCLLDTLLTKFNQKTYWEQYLKQTREWMTSYYVSKKDISLAFKKSPLHFLALYFAYVLWIDFGSKKVKIHVFRFLVTTLVPLDSGHRYRIKSHRYQLNFFLLVPKTGYDHKGLRKIIKKSKSPWL